MTELIITPNYDKKTARFKGTIAGGESVKVTIVGAAKWFSSGLRLRVVCGCSLTVAMFPLKSEDGTVSSFEVVGDDLIAAPLELNTIQARLLTQGLATTAATFIVEDLEKNILYFQDSYELHGWVKRDGDDEPYDLTKFPELIEDWRKQIESLIVDAKEVDGGIEVTICNGVSPAKTFIIRNGRDGQPGEPGRKGEDGKSLKFSDLTDAQKAELKGPKGDTGDGITDELKALPNKVTENAQAIEANRVAINTEENRAKGAEKELLTRIEESKANAAAAMTAASKAQDTADKTVTEIATLIGDDAGDKRKSARQIAAEEVAKVIAGADTNYDTLKEIADYIKNDATDAAQLKNKVTNLEANKADKTALETEEARAKNAEAALDGRVKELENNGGGGGSSVIVDDTLTKDGENPVKSKGIWSAIWGAISAPAASVYAWVTAALAKKRDLDNRDYVVKIDPIKETHDSRFVIYDASGTARLTLNRVGEVWVGDPSNVYIQWGDAGAPPSGVDATYLFYIYVKPETKHCLIYKRGCLSYSAEVTLDSNYYAEATVDGVAIKIKGVTEVTDSFALQRDIPGAPDLTAYAKTADVPAAIAGKEIKPSSVVVELDGGGGWIAKAIEITPDQIYYVKYLNEDTIEKELSVPWAHILNAIPKYNFVDFAENGGAIMLFPFAIRRVNGVGEDISISISSSEGAARDMVLVVDATVETHILWEDGATTFHPRGGDAANLEVVAGKRNVFFITEVQPNVFMVARDELALPDAGGGE